MWSASPELSFEITDGILACKSNGEAVSDLYFNAADYSYWDIVLDLSVKSTKSAFGVKL